LTSYFTLNLKSKLKSTHQRVDDGGVVAVPSRHRLAVPGRQRSVRRRGGRSGGPARVVAEFLGSKTEQRGGPAVGVPWSVLGLPRVVSYHPVCRVLPSVAPIPPRLQQPIVEQTLKVQKLQCCDSNVIEIMSDSILMADDDVESRIHIKNSMLPNNRSTST
jgi:hypothetical protein